MAIDIVVAEIFLIVTSIIAIIFGVMNALAVHAVDMDEIKGAAQDMSEHDSLMDDHDDDGRDRADPKKIETIDQQKLDLMLDLHGKISDGANNFLFKEYAYLIVFCILFGLVIFFLAETNVGEVWTVISFEIGAVTSIIAGYIGMRIAVTANVRTTKECAFTLSRGFVVAYKAGAVLGFTLVGLCLLLLVIIIIAYRLTFLPQNPEDRVWYDYQMMFEKIAGYGLGGSSIALFGRVGGGIYTKAADVGADLAGKVVKGLPEDDIRNPGTIADNVGDNVGDIAGMGADLFGSLAESSCAALVVSGTSADLVLNTGAFYFPLMITGMGILASIITWCFATQQGMCCKIDKFSDVEKVIKYQIIISTLILIPGLLITA
jgi:H(+)-translocating pyrophosphatase